MGRHTHDGARPVRGQHVVAHQHRHPLAVERVDAVRAGRHAGLFALGGRAFDLARASRPCDVFVNFVARCSGWVRTSTSLCSGASTTKVTPKMVSIRVVKRVDLLARRELARVERDSHALRPADPVALHHADLLRPVDLVHVQQFIGVLRDAKEPLRQVPPLHGRLATLARPVLNLLVGQRGLVLRAPVGCAFGPVGQAGLEHLQEEILVPPVVLRIAGDHLPRPVVRVAHEAELAAQVLYSIVCPLARVDVVGNGGVFCGQAECVEALRVHDVVALHPLEARAHVAAREGEPVADVQVPRGVGEHRESEPVVLAVGVVFCVVQAGIAPTLLPLGFDLARHVSGLRSFGGFALSHRGGQLICSVCGNIRIRRTRPQLRQF